MNDLGFTTQRTSLCCVIGDGEEECVACFLLISRNNLDLLKKIIEQFVEQNLYRPKIVYAENIPIAPPPPSF